MPSTDPHSRRRAQPRALALLAALVVSTCGGGSTRVETVTETVALTPLRVGAAASGEADWSSRPWVEHTDEVVVAPLGQALVFEDLDLPAGARLTAELRPVGPDENAAGVVSLSVTGHGDEGDEPSSATLQLDLARTPGQYFTKLDLPLPAHAHRLELTFERQGERRDLAVAMMRPRVSFPREVEVRESDATQVVLVTLDTMRADFLGSHGHPAQASPHLDAFAAEGLRFEHCFSTSNVTNPSHTSIFTSLHLKDHDVKDNFTKLSNTVPNIVGSLGARGFRTAGFAASHTFEPGLTGFDTLFEEFYPSHSRQRRAEDVNLDLFPWLVEHHDEDFFVWIHYFDVHAPYDAPAPYHLRYPYGGGDADPAMVTDRPKWSRVWKDRAFLRAQYLGELAYMDDRFGELVDHMDALGILERAWFAVTADHGESLGEHKLFATHKGLHDTTTHVPLFFRGPNVERGVASGLVSTLDVWPTLFDYLDLPITNTVRGRSLRGLVAGASDRDEVYSEAAYGSQLSVRTNEHRAVLGIFDKELVKGINVRKGQLELFDLLADPEEKRDLAANNRDLASRFRERLDAFPEDGLRLGAEAVDDADFAAELEGLGYTR